MTMTLTGLYSVQAKENIKVVIDFEIAVLLSTSTASLKPQAMFCTTGHFPPILNLRSHDAANTCITTPF